MKAETIRKVDVWIGKPLCWLLTRWRKFTEMDKALNDKPRKILLIKMTEQGATVLAWRAMERAIQMVGRENVYFWVFEENRPILDMMGMIPPENVIAINSGSLGSAGRDVIASLLKIRLLGIDATVDMEFFARSSAVLGYLTGAKKRVGLHRFTTEGPYRGDLMTHRVEHNPYLHVSMAYLVLVECLLRDPRETPMAKMAVPELDLQPPKLVIRKEDVEGVQEVLRVTGGYLPSGPIVLLNPNASDMLPLRRWESSRFVELARRILGEFPEATVLFTGGKRESEAAEQLAQEVESNRCFCVAGKTTLRQLFALYSISKVLVTNDSGPGHFSSLTDIAAIVLFGPETPRVFGPVGRNARAVWAGIACSPCVNAMNHRVSPCNNNVCMQMIGVEQVYRMVKTAITTQPARGI
jgi:ADP-heptose:LPS heptosyltransferase